MGGCGSVEFRYSKRMTAISLPVAREQLGKLITQVSANHEPVVIDSDGCKAVLVSLEDYGEMDTTAYLMSNPVMKARIDSAIEQLRRGEGVERDIDLDA